MEHAIDVSIVIHAVEKNKNRDVENAIEEW